jgi:hypothetical protein
MFRTIFLCLFLFPSSLQAETSLEGSLDALLKAPWTESPSSLPDSTAWTAEPYTISVTQEEQGYNLRAFVKNDGPVRTKIFTYAEPSLTSFRETILMGYIQAAKQTEKEAKGFHGEMIACLKSRGFESMPPDTTRLAVMLRNTYRDSELFRKGEMDGRVYYIKDDRSGKWFVRTSISHSRFREFKNKWMAEWPKWWDSSHIMPVKLVRELEEGDVSLMLSPALWDSLKYMSTMPRGSFKHEKKYIPKMVSAYEKIDATVFPEGDRPAVLLFKNYLVRYLFMSGWNTKITSVQAQWLEAHGLTCTYSTLGGTNIYQETNLWNLLEKYPDTYWGQFAFFELLERGFDTSGTCRNGNDQWRTVLDLGLDFLVKHTDSVFAPDTNFYLGKAAETLYNLGIVEDYPARETSGLSKDQFADKSEDARIKAIKYYEEVLQSPQKEKYEDHLKNILPRLRAGFGTGCTYYFCFYD